MSIDGQSVASRIDRGAAGQQGEVRVGPPLFARVGGETGIGDADLVAVRAVGQAAGAAGSDQVVGTGRATCRRCRWRSRSCRYRLC